MSAQPHPIPAPAQGGIRERLAALEALYDSLPRLECKGLCHESCGPVVMTKIEWDRIRKAMGYTPTLGKDLTCPMLNRETLRCRVYRYRPMICRLWGMVAHKYMRCPHGCEPKRWLTDDESRALLAAAGEIGG